MKRLGLVVMAAGDSQRFEKGNKLLESFGGKTLIALAIDAIPTSKFSKIIVVTGHDDIIDLAKKHDLAVLVNTQPEKGIGVTIKRGLSKIADDLDGCMFLVCDQPKLKKQTLIDLIDFWNVSPNNMASLSYHERLGNPVIFPKSLFSAILAIKDDQLGKVVINENLLMLKKLPIKDASELFDVDTLADLESIKKEQR
jgi:molybdenum cofactor cytidylyltransferase